MSQATKILTELERRGVIVALDGDTLSLKPRRSLDDALLARVREAKPAILEALRSRPATCAASCYRLTRAAGFIIPGMAVPRSSRKRTHLCARFGRPAGTATARRNAAASCAGKQCRASVWSAKGAGRCGGGFNESRRGRRAPFAHRGGCASRHEGRE